MWGKVVEYEIFFVTLQPIFKIRGIRSQTLDDLKTENG